MLRKNSHLDREFVEKIAGKFNIPVTSEEINLKGIAKIGSLEEIARNARLGFLFKVAKEIKADKISLGHNLDDQVETVLMRILRGTGLYGLGGILPKRNIGGFVIIRPLIEVSRKDIEIFLKNKMIKPRIDASNAQDIFFRNKIRNRLLPLLEKEYNKNIKQVLSNMSKIACYDYDYLHRSANQAMKTMKGRIDLDKFKKLHPAMQRMVLRLNISHLKGDTRRIEFRHIEEIEDLILYRPVNSVVDLPKGISVVKKKKNLCFYCRKPAGTS
jgi:tRNA(Ile)-lysidine synthase